MIATTYDTAREQMRQSLAAEAGRYSRPSDLLMSRMPDMVKGLGYVDGNRPLEDSGRIHEVARAALSLMDAEFRRAVGEPDTRKALNPSFAAQFPNFLAPSPQQQWLMNTLGAIGGAVNPDLLKDISLNSPLSGGLVPFDLSAPARLIYPVYTPFHNKLPRVPGQGTSHRAYLITGISGSLTPSGSGQFIDPFTSEPGLTTWPAQAPVNVGSQSATAINIPYKLVQMSEALSWVAQFAGQGFQDIAGLVNLILMQETFLQEEGAIIWSTATALSTPGAVTIASRAAGSNETPVPASGTAGNDYYVVVTALTAYGETLMSTAVASTIANQTGKVADITITPVPGAAYYRVYVSAAASSAPGTAAGYFLQSDNQGGMRYTLQGTPASSGANPPASNTTALANGWEGMLSVMSGHASNVYPAGFEAGYINQKAAGVLDVGEFESACVALYANGSYKADPTELIVEGSDARNLADSLASQNNGNTGYFFQVDQNQVGSVIAGRAVSSVVNPVTRNPVRVTVHPWINQGTAMLMSYTLPIPNTNVSNVIEMAMVQDILTIQWPVIDPTFRYSAYEYGTPVFNAPQYCGLIQGLQRSGSTPYS